MNFYVELLDILDRISQQQTETQATLLHTQETLSHLSKRMSALEARTNALIEELSKEPDITPFLTRFEKVLNSSLSKQSAQFKESMEKFSETLVENLKTLLG